MQVDTDVMILRPQSYRTLFAQAAATLRIHGATVIESIEAILFDASAYFDMESLVIGTDVKVNLNKYLAVAQSFRSRPG
jgi:hypothetical protein